MESIITQQEQRNSSRGKIISVVVHIGLILLALLPLLHYPDPPPGQEGILVNLGLPDVGEGDNNAGPTASAEPEPAEETPEVEESQPEPEPEEVKPEPVPEKEVVKTEDPNEVALKRKQEEERKKQEDSDRKKRAEEDAKKKADADAKRKAEADAKAKAEADAAAARRQAEADKLKNDIGGLFGDGSGKGNTGKPGNQGDPNGDPNAANLEGISTGSGKVGGGLGDRGILKSPAVSENSQKAGTVVVSVCVDGNGKVTSADYTQRGSTTTDSQLVNAAIKNAKNWQFSSGSQERLCGTITYNFKVR